jgi:glycosyltransferase involved in cell wall biosynthesis
MNQILVSIITPNYNSASYIEETKNSIINQTYTRWEWLIIDDGSTDSSIDMIAEFSNNDNRIKLINRQHPNKGASVCRNIGIENANGNYLIFLDSDDILSSFCLEQRVKKIKENPDLDFGVFNMETFNDTLDNLQERVNLYAQKITEYLPMFLSYKIPWQTTCPIWKSSFIKEKNIRFSENYERMQDPEFHSKILFLYKPNFKVFNESLPDCFYRQSKTKKSNNASVLKATSSVLLYYKEMVQLIRSYHQEDEYDSCLDSFVINVFHSLLFYTKLCNITPIVNLFHQMKKIRPINNITLDKIYFFAIMNKLQLSFIKGAGITRLWNKLYDD